MTFLVEDGTGLSASNSYAALLAADAYFLLRGNTTWSSASTVEKQAALVKATDYVDARFTWIGTALTTTQALDWPRDEEGLPPDLVKAVYEYAVRALSAELLPDPVLDVTGIKRVKIKEVLGPIEDEWQVVEGGSGYVFIPYPYADQLLKNLTYSSRQVIR